MFPWHNTNTIGIFEVAPLVYYLKVILKIAKPTFKTIVKYWLHIYAMSV